MSFVSKAEMYSHIYEETMDAISNSNDTFINNAISAAVAEAQSYMSRYDSVSLFAAVDPDRDPLLLLYIKDMAKWHFIPLANPNIDYDYAKDRYNKAMAWFRRVQDGDAVPFGWPLATVPDNSTFFHAASNPKRESHY